MRGLTALAATAALLAACDPEETLAPEAAPATSAEAATGVILSARPEQRLSLIHISEPTRRS